MSTTSVVGLKTPCPDMNMKMQSDDMTEGMCCLWEQRLLLNLTIQVEDHEFQVHREAMIATSDYFRTLLTGSMASGKMDSVEVKGVSPIIMENIISFVYTHQIAISKDNALDMLNAAMFFLIRPAITFCSQFILENLDAENWFDVLTLFLNLSLTDDADTVRKYVKRNIREVVKTFDNTQLPYGELHLLVDNWRSADYDLFCFIKRWVDADHEGRKEHLDSLLVCVRYCLMTPTELATIKELQIYQHTHNSWSVLVDKAVDYHKLPMYQKVLYVSEQHTVRSSPSLILFAGQQSPTGGQFCDPLHENRLTPHEGLKTPGGFSHCRFGADVEINNFLILSDGGQWFIFDPRTLQWEEIAPLERALCVSNVAYYEGYLYTIGGDDFMEVITTIERYDFKTNTWSYFSKFPNEICSLAACIIENGLYLCGGHFNEGYSHNESDIDGQRMSRVSRLDLTTRRWEGRAPMLKSRTHHSAHVMKILGEDCICIFDDSFNLEYYSPTNNQWSRLSFTFNIPPPVKNDREGDLDIPERVRGNVYSVADVEGDTNAFGDDQKAIALVSIPEYGTDKAHVEYVYYYKGELRQRYADGSHYSILSFSPHVQLPVV